MWFLYDCKIPFSTTHQETLKKYRLITYKSYTADLGLYIEVIGGNREPTQGLGLCFYWGLVRGLGFPWLTRYWWISDTV